MMTIDTKKATWAALAILWCAVAAQATDRFVSESGSHDSAGGFTTWVGAATNIQAAVDAASPEDVVRVADGIYDIGLTNYPGRNAKTRVLINKAIIVRSESGNPAAAIIRGEWGADTNGVGAVRCVHMGSNSKLIGFTLTHGATLTSVQSGNYADRRGGGVETEGTGAVISNCVVTGNASPDAGVVARGGANSSDGVEDCFVYGSWITNNFGSGAYGAKLYDSVISGNSAYKGGGAEASVLYRCGVSNNVAAGGGGGGVNASTLYDCNISGNVALYHGGGTYSSILSNCWVTANWSGRGGGGIYSTTAYDSQIVANYCSSGSSGGGISAGGGSAGGTLYRCAVSNNVCPYGGGTSSSTLYDSLISSNSATYTPGGVLGGTLSNCVVRLNYAGRNAGGVNNATLYDCVVSNNYAGASYGTDPGGAGAYGGTLYRTLLTGNRTGGSGYGGGIVGGSLYSCVVTNNTAKYGGGAYLGIHYNSTFYGNNATTSGGGVRKGTLYNCISWANNREDVEAVATNSCGTGAVYANMSAGNTSLDPLFINAPNDLSLRGTSPCRDKGMTFVWMTDAADSRSTDFSGAPRVQNDIVDMGAYERAVIISTILTIR